MAWRISAILVTLALLGGCNTMHGMGQDVDSVFGTNLSGDHTAASGNSSGTSTTAAAGNGSTTSSTSSSASTSAGSSNGSAAH